VNITRLSAADIIAHQHLKRWHMVRVGRAQTLAEHCGTVAMIAAHVASMLFEDAGYTVLEGMQEMLWTLDYALTHDAHEIEYGDPPSPAVKIAPEAHAACVDAFWRKRRGREATSPVARTAVEVADKLEAAVFYVLEGQDPNLKRGCMEKARLVAAAAGPRVASWVEDVLLAVSAGTFTPQPGTDWQT
jgi:5'-deoxynucleotidase YfbR-like HD superfamily hydrolase